MQTIPSFNAIIEKVLSTIGNLMPLPTIKERHCNIMMWQGK